MEVPIEDGFEDILAKARRGVGCSVADLAREAGVSESNAYAVMDGHFEENVVRALAEALHLDADSLVRLGRNEYRPEAPAVEGVEGFTTEFGSMLVNAYLAWDPETRAGFAIDTGARCRRMIDCIRKNALDIRAILLTHSHQDHVVDLVALRDALGVPARISSAEALPGCEQFEAGERFEAGGIRVETRLTTGHSRGGTTYVVEGLERPVAFVGDALFAGSMGGPKVSYADALDTARRGIFSLPGNTVLYPGHGPATTVEQELRGNPFFAVRG